MTVRVLVTGAAGFVGQHLCRLLVSQGAAVRAICRTPSPTLLLAGVDVRYGDITDAAAVTSATRDVDVVVHLAARVHVMHEVAADPLAEFRRVNLTGSAVVAAAARDNAVRHVLFVSSVKAAGDASTSAWRSGMAEAPTDPYGVSKLEAERLLLSCADKRLAVTVLRFPLVYGPGMRGNMLRLFRMIDRGFPVPVGSTGNRRSLLYVANATAAIARVIACVADGRASSLLPRALFVADGPALSTEMLANLIAAAMGTSARAVRLPEQPLRQIARVADPFTRTPLSGVLNRLLGSLEVDEKEFEDAYDYTPPYTTQAGINLTARWFRQS